MFINQLDRFAGLPSCLKINSAKLVHQRRRRTLFICGVIVSMCMLSAIGLVLCPSSSYNGTTTDMKLSNVSWDREATLSITHTIQQNITIRAPAIGGLSIESIANLSSPLESFELSHRPYTLVRNGRNPISIPPDDTFRCVHREYIVFTWVLCLVSLATALKLYYLIKAIMALGMVAFYTTLIFIRFSTEESFSLAKLRQHGMPLGVQMLILLITFLIMVCYHARLVEVCLIYNTVDNE